MAPSVIERRAVLELALSVVAVSSDALSYFGIGYAGKPELERLLSRDVGWGSRKRERLMELLISHSRLDILHDLTGLKRNPVVAEVGGAVWLLGTVDREIRVDRRLPLQRDQVLGELRVEVHETMPEGRHGD